MFPQLEMIGSDTVQHGMVRNAGSLLCLDLLPDDQRGVAADQRGVVGGERGVARYQLKLSACRGDQNQVGGAWDAVGEV